MRYKIAGLVKALGECHGSSRRTAAGLTCPESRPFSKGTLTFELHRKVVSWIIAREVRDGWGEAGPRVHKTLPPLWLLQKLIVSTNR